MKRRQRQARFGPAWTNRAAAQRARRAALIPDGYQDMGYVTPDFLYTGLAPGTRQRAVWPFPHEQIDRLAVSAVVLQPWQRHVLEALHLDADAVERALRPLLVRGRRVPPIILTTASRSVDLLPSGKIGPSGDARDTSHHEWEAGRA